MAGRASAKAKKNWKRVFVRIVTIVVVSIMAGGILLAALLSRPF